MKEWLAGLIDGDGCFQLTKKGYASLEIIMDIRDEHALQIIKNIYGGSIKLRSGANALRYRLHHKSGLLNLINDVNGLIRNSNRLVQLKKICDKYQINFIFPEELNYENGWFSGLFDSDGTVTINKTNTQLSLSVSQKTSELLLPLVKLYGGYIYIDNGNNKSFKWYIYKKEEVLNLIEYFKKYPSLSFLKYRLHLIPKFYELYDLGAHIAPQDSLLFKSWLIFTEKWNKLVPSSHLDNNTNIGLKFKPNNPGNHTSLNFNNISRSHKRNYSSYTFTYKLLQPQFITGFTDG